MMKGKVGFVLLCIVLNFQIQAQAPYFEAYSLLHKRETIQVNAMLQDRDGYIWFATTRGLFRFDGTGYLRYTTADSLLDDNVTAIASDSSGRLWIGYNNGKISFLHMGGISAFSPEEGTSSERISDMLFDRKGNLWFSTMNDGLYYYTSQRLYRVDEDEGMPDLFVYDIAEDSAGNILAGTDGGVAVCSLTGAKVSVSVLDHNAGLPDNIVRKILVTADSYLLATEDAGVISYDPHNGSFRPLLDSWKEGAVTDIVMKGNQIWMGTAENGIILYDRVTQDMRIYRRSGVSRSVNCLLRDTEQNIWAGSKSGVERTAGNGIEFYGELPGQKDRNILAVARDDHGQIWFSNHDGLFRARTEEAGAFTAVKHLSGTRLEQYTIISLYTDPMGFVWAGLYGEGVLRIDPLSGKATHFHDELRNGNVLNISGKGDHIWMATLGGATRVTLENGKMVFKNFSSEDGLSSDFIYQVFVDSRQRIWFATDGKGVDMLDEKGFHHLDKGLPSKIIYGIAEDRQGTIWVNVQGNGLYTFDGTESFEPVPVSLAPRKNEIHALSADKTGNMLVCHDEGLDLIDPVSRRIKYIGDESGLKDKIANFNAVTRAADGTLYIGTFDGIVRFSEGSQFLATAPVPKISTVKIFDREIAAHQLSDLSHDENNVTFNYIGLWYQNPSSLFFSYKLENYDLEWIHSKNNSVTYSQLPPGSYTFRVKASETDSFDKSTEAIVTFTIAPPFWKTRIFYFLAIIVLGVSSYGFVKYRERSLRYNNMLLEARVRARTREIQRQNDEIQAQNEEISTQAEEIKGINENLETLVLDRTAELERKNKALEEYAFINAHKLRSPVASILGLAHLMSKTNLDPEGKEINERLQQAVDELDDVVRSITRVIESGDRKFPIERTRRDREEDQ
jgi:ligand-binding sensor domain-containing protein